MVHFLVYMSSDSHLLLPTKVLNQNQYHISGGISEINIIFKALKDAGMVIPTTPNSMNRSWEMTISRGDSIAAAVTDVVLLCQIVPIGCGTWHTAVDLVNNFSSCTC